MVEWSATDASKSLRELRGEVCAGAFGLYVVRHFMAHQGRQKERNYLGMVMATRIRH